MPEYRMELELRFIVEAEDYEGAFQEAAKILIARMSNLDWFQYKVVTAEEGVREYINKPLD